MRRILQALMVTSLLLAPTPSLAQNTGTQNATSEGVVNVPVTGGLSAEQEQQVQRIGMKIHCPICKGESIAQSQTDISRNMMNQVREMVRAGQSESAILEYFRQSYSDRILLEPPKRGLTSLLWTLPIAFFVLGGLGWWSYMARASRPAQRTLTPEEEARIRELMRGGSDDG